jgi:hypothetical protein
MVSTYDGAPRCVSRHRRVTQQRSDATLHLIHTDEAVVMSGGMLKQDVPYDGIIGMQFVNSIDGAK